MDVADARWLVIASLAIAALGFATWYLCRRRAQSARLRCRFGAAYDQAVVRHGGRRKAEAELKARERSVEREGITALTVYDVERVSWEWSVLQRRFVDAPAETLVAAEQLVRDVMRRRGYRIPESALAAPDAPVDRPSIVEAYCKVRKMTAYGDRDGSTEELRRAVLRYRGLLNELLEVAKSGEAPVVEELPGLREAGFATET